MTAFASSPEALASRHARRPIGLSLMIILLAVGTVVGIATELSGRMEMLAVVDRANAGVRATYYAILPLSLVSLAGLWLWKRWAIWLTLVVDVVRIAVEIALAMPVVHIVRVPIALTLLMALAWRHRRRFV